MAITQRRAAPSPYIDPEHPNVQRWDNGLVLYTEFITEEEEAAMTEAVLRDAQWTDARQRLSLHFGPHFDYTTFATSETASSPPPTYITDLLPRLPIQEYLPDQFTVQYYPPGTGIPPHVDTHSAFREALYSLSFGSAVPMEFKKCGAKEARRIRLPKRSLAGNTGTIEASIGNSPGPKSFTEETDAERWELFLPPRSLLVMMGPSRYGFTHKIKGRKFDQRDGQTVERKGRYSITMRSVKRGDEVGCDCDYPEVCDARVREKEKRRLAAEGTKSCPQ
jgi:alkylated DNA repair protein alkB family protein 8